MDRLDEAFAHLYRTYFGDQQHERSEIETLPRLLEGVDLFIDVGASLGMYTYYANEIMANGHIIAIEADPDRFSELRRNCEKWGATSTNTIEAVFAAVGDSRQPVTFWTTGTQISGGLFPVDERPADYHPVEVPQIMLDDYAETGSAATLVKIDVEGGEMRVMRGASRLIEAGAAFLTEITWWGDRERGYSVLTFLNFLRRSGLWIRKNTNRRNSSYYLRQGKGGYVKAAPILILKHVWGTYIPKPVRRRVEALLGRRRVRRHT